jgi:nucleoside phosphorylase
MGSTSSLGLSDATFGIVCALSKELTAVRAVFDCVADPTTETIASGRKYALAEVKTEGGEKHVVAIAVLPEMGNNAAAIRATHLLDDCPSVVHLLMVGIGGAVPHPENAEHHVRLGDIVVSGRSGIIQYDLVKEASDGTIEHRNAPRAPSGKLMEAVNWLQSDEELGKRPWESFIEQGIQRLGPAWKRPAPEEDVLDDGDGTSPVCHPEDPGRRPGQPRVFHGPIAAANVLLKNADKREDLRSRFGAKAVEMEGSGIADAAWDGQVGYLIIRGTCDYCNRNKNDAWQKYAAVIAAAYARALIASMPSHDRPRPSEEAFDLTELPGVTPTQPDLRYLYDRAFEHGRLSAQLIVVPSPESTQGAVASRMLERERRSLAPSDAEGTPSYLGIHDELRRMVRLVRNHLDSFDHDLASEVANDVARLLAEHADLLSQASRKEALDLLTDVAIIEFKRMRQDSKPGASIARARELLAASKDARGGHDRIRCGTRRYRGLR